MDAVKIALGLAAVSLTFVAYVPYIRSILTNKTKPHIYSWSVWLLDGLIIFGLQITHGAGPGAFMTLAATTMSLTVLLLAIFRRGKRDIQTIDTVFLILALLALVIWLFAKQPLVSALLIVCVDLLGFMPTVRKSWYKPYSENLYFYEINVVRFGLTLLALQQYSLITTFYPGVWLVINILFVLMLIIRRKAR